MIAQRCYNSLWLRTLTFFVSWALPYLASAQNSWTPKEQVCAFKRPLYVGASVTAAFPKKLMVYNEFTTLVLNTPYVSMGGNPGALVSYKYREAFLPQRESQMTPSRKPLLIERERNTGVGVTSSEKDLGTYQILSMLDADGDRHASYKWASVIFGVDLFYWDSIWDYCGYDQGLVNQQGQRVDVEHNIQRLIRQAYQDKKVLILGTVPEDRADKVPISNLNFQSKKSEKKSEQSFHFGELIIEEYSEPKVETKGFWFEPEVACVQSINATIHQHCRAEKNCYIVDLHELVRRLYTGEKITLQNGKAYSLYEFRPDGVHLSANGSQLAAEEMIKSIESSPPRCQD